MIENHIKMNLYKMMDKTLDHVKMNVYIHSKKKKKNKNKNKNKYKVTTLAHIHYINNKALMGTNSL